MSEIVIGIGTSHSPLLAIETKLWAQRGEDDIRNPTLTLSDGRELNYATLLAERGDVFAANNSIDHLQRQAVVCNQALDRMADDLAGSNPDLVVIIGDDQDELYRPGNTPSVAVFHGPEVIMQPLGESLANPPEWLRRALEGYAMDRIHRFPGCPQFALALTDRLMDAGVDVAVHSDVETPADAGFGHAFGFVAQRLLRGKAIPILPIMFNTYFPPNVLRPWRALEVGEKIGAAIRDIPDARRIAVVASGGLSHFVTDEHLDRRILDALERDDREAMRNIPMRTLKAGSSEILCWIMAAGAWAPLRHKWTEYQPVYRTPAGTGIGLGFGVWN